MTNTNTMDTLATVDQVKRLVDRGCEVVRITTPGIREAQNLYEIRNQLVKQRYHVPLVADVHFNPRAAEIAAAIVDKVRINPGNYTDKKKHNYRYSEDDDATCLTIAEEKLLPLIEICMKHHAAIRVGTNHGSLSDRILARYGNTAEGMVASTMEFVELFRRYNFHQLVLSLKSSHVPTMIRANKLLVSKMTAAGFYYPIHLGVTEAGNGMEARIKSAAGIGGLLLSGIGDTIRVSLTEDPCMEVPVAGKLVELYGRKEPFIHGLQTENKHYKTEGQTQKTLVVTREKVQESDLSAHELIEVHESESFRRNQLVHLIYGNASQDEMILRSSAELSYLSSDVKPSAVWIESDTFQNDRQAASYTLDLLQGLGLRYSKTEFVACPSCGRTNFNLMDQFNAVKKATKHLTGLKIAVMGCAVNGPGEMADADYGYVGAGKGKVNLYRKDQLLKRNIAEENALEELINLIKEGDDWQESSIS